MPGEMFVARLDVQGDVLGANHRNERIVQDIHVEVTEEDIEEEPPPELLDALSNLAMYKLQDRARKALEQGDTAAAARKLEFLATRLFEEGQDSLGQTALHEARQVARTQKLSEEGVKELKYGTRALATGLFGEQDG